MKFCQRTKYKRGFSKLIGVVSKIKRLFGAHKTIPLQNVGILLVILKQWIWWNGVAKLQICFYKVVEVSNEWPDMCTLHEIDQKGIKTEKTNRWTQRRPERFHNGRIRRQWAPVLTLYIYCHLCGVIGFLFEAYFRKNLTYSWKFISESTDLLDFRAVFINSKHFKSDR